MFVLSGALLLVPMLLIASMLSARHLDGLTKQFSPEPRDFVLDNVHLIPVSQAGVLRDRQLVIRTGRIAALESTRIPLNHELPVVDGGGAFVTPGFFDMHVHVDDPQQLRLALSYGITSLRNMDGMPMHLRWKAEMEQGQWKHGYRDGYIAFIDAEIGDASG